MMSTCIVQFCGFVSCTSRKKQLAEVEKYMETIPRNQNVVYVDSADSIYFHNRTEDSKNDNTEVIFVNKEYIFYSIRKGKNEKIYRAKHDYSQEEFLFEITDCFTKIIMYDENKAFYGLKENNEHHYYVRYISEGKTESITEEKYGVSNTENDYFSVKIQNEYQNIFKGYKVIGFEITDKKTGTTKLVNNEDMQEILKIEQAKKINEYDELSYFDYALKDDRIYIACYNSDILMLFEYDFETEKVRFFDWLNYNEDVALTDLFYIYVF